MIHIIVKGVMFGLKHIAEIHFARFVSKDQLLRSDYIPEDAEDVKKYIGQ